MQRIDEILRAFLSLAVRGLPIGPEASAVLAGASAEAREMRSMRELSAEISALRAAERQTVR